MKNIGICGIYLNQPTNNFCKYTIKLINALSKYDEHNQYIVYIADKLSEGIIDSLHISNNIKFNYIGETYYYSVKNKAITNRIKYEEVLIDLIEESCKAIDILYYPCNFIPLKRSNKFKFAVTIHDLIPLLYFRWSNIFTHKEYYTYTSFFNAISLKMRVNKLNYISFLSTVSDVTKNELSNYYNNKDKITVIPNWLDNNYSESKDFYGIEKIRIKYKLNSKYIIYVGGLSSRKNISTLLKIYGNLPKSINGEVNLVCIGSINPSDKQYRILKEYNIIDKVIWLGFIEESELPLLYSGAELFLSASSYEGFGVPPLEAMACGIPVVLSDIEAFREVVGSEGIFFNTFDYKSASQLVLNLLKDESLRKKQIEYGLNRSKLFSEKDSIVKLINQFNSDSH